MTFFFVIFIREDVYSNWIGYLSDVVFKFEKCKSEAE